MIEVTQHPIVKAIISGIPSAGGPIDVIFSHLAQKRRERKKAILFEEIRKGNIRITEDRAQSDEFIHCFTISAQAAMRAHHDEKIRLFARGLVNAIEDDWFSEVDEFEEIVSAIDGMSLREWKILKMLSAFRNQKGARGEEGNTGNIEEKNSFYASVSQEVLIKAEEVEDYLHRLERTGMIKKGEILWGGGYELSVNTPMYYRAEKFVADRQANKEGR